MNNLKQIGLAFRIYAADNQDRYPTHGWSDRSTWTTSNLSPVAVYGMMARELNRRRLLTCPADKRASTTSFNSLGSSNISYFVGMRPDFLHHIIEVARLVVTLDLVDVYDEMLQFIRMFPQQCANALRTRLKMLIRNIFAPHSGMWR
jgi:hypothetical protein